MEKALTAAAHGPMGGDLVWEAKGDKVVVGVDRDFVTSVLAGSGLARSATYTKVLPGVKDASGVLFVDFDAGGWLARVVGKHDRAAAERSMRWV
ncbi:hypothetical protein [Nocardioides jiangxiensis]|uniref:Uncharacterized protein n=1 Tax=Nocardioides jiangxiensis TaxID=3064524 RepID=A0ABT9B3R1_9ACTN|nr:hypothetical protein [Nocardioides sp. WY-20]MDO7869362.1 hypothetical protein [Nocardioides sp. WY-20]